jgi:hypothetical protein
VQSPDGHEKVQFCPAGQSQVCASTQTVLPLEPVLPEPPVELVGPRPVEPVAEVVVDVVVFPVVPPLLVLELLEPSVDVQPASISTTNKLHTRARWANMVSLSV